MKSIIKTLLRSGTSFNLNFGKLTLILCLFSILSTSCSDNDPIEPDNGGKDNGNIPPEKGRFDNSPFVWDVIYAPERSADQIYIGDMSIQVVDDGVSLKSRNSGGRSSGDRSSSRDGSSSGRTSGDSPSGSQTDKIMVVNPIGVYLGAVFPESSYLGDFDREITSPKNPIDVVFDFKDPFIDYITRETGSIGYKTSLKNALKSPEYRTHLSADRESLEYYFTEFSSYKDVEKAFTGNVGLGSIFSSQVEKNSKNTRKNGRLLARLVSRNFNVYYGLSRQWHF